MTNIQRVGVVGGGQMGAGIAEVCAPVEPGRAGVRIQRGSVPAGARARRRTRWPARNASGSSPTSRTTARSPTFATPTTSSSLADRDLVIEAVVEDPEAKTAIFAQLDATVGEHTVLASNTSSIPIINLAMATGRAEQVIGIHFFNPVPVMPLVEIVTSLRTSPGTIEAATEFAASTLGKQVITSSDRAGFVVNALLVPYLLSAIRMLESGFASAGDIDAGMRLGCAHPMGPLELADLIGLDTTAAIAGSMYEEFKEPHLAPPALLLRMVKAQHLGRKSGRGFFEYAN